MLTVNGRSDRAPRQPIVNRKLQGVDPCRRWRNFDAFDLALNHA